jgi:hypothetical protein
MIPASEIKGFDLPGPVSIEQRFGPPVVEGDNVTQDTTRGDWWRENSGEIIQAVPSLLCALFPKTCQTPASDRGSSGGRPVVIQENRKPDWLTIGLIVVVLVLLLVIILKK